MLGLESVIFAGWGMFRRITKDVLLLFYSSEESGMLTTMFNLHEKFELKSTASI
jgi:hypothetical protein